MAIFFTILIVLLIVILIIGFLLLLIAIFPFKYYFRVKYEKVSIYLDFNYVFLNFSLFLSMRSKIKYKAIFLNRVIADSEKKKVSESDEISEKDESIEDTDFIDNKDLSEQVKENDNIIKELFINAKKRQQDISKAEDIDEEQALSFIDRFKVILPKDLLDMIKLITKEALRFYSYIKPKKVTVEVDTGFDDPFLTGMALAFAAPFYAEMGDDLKINPSFDHYKFRAEIVASRRPLIFFIMIPIANLFLNKRFRDIFFKSRKARKAKIQIRT